jgi:hypothetical protein
MGIEYIALILVAAAILFTLLYNRFSKKEEEISRGVKPGKSNRKPTKKALLVGLNKYHPMLNADLRGCVNDVENMRDLLMNKFGFEPENIRVIIDDRATRQAIIDRLRWLINGSIAGDELVFHFSGHGSQVRDRNGDELNDRLDEILCPYDLDWSNPLTDDILAAMLKKLPKGVFFTMICDSCHSGTMTRGGRLGNPHGEMARFIRPPYDIRSRSLDRELPKRKIGIKEKRNKKRGKPDTGQNHILVSGCRDDQTSADAFINNKYQGAMTWALTKAIKENPGITWNGAHAEAVKTLKAGKYIQEPQLSGNDGLTCRVTFGGNN